VNDLILGPSIGAILAHSTSSYEAVPVGYVPRGCGGRLKINVPQSLGLGSGPMKKVTSRFEV
jgi:hypothetical protein